MVEKINSSEKPSVEREVHRLHNSEMTVSPQQAKGGVGLRLGTKDGPVFGIYSTDELPRDAYGYRVFDGTQIGPGVPFLLVAYPRHPSSGAHAGFEELEIGKGVTLGRRERLTEKNLPNSPIHSSEYVSRLHAGIKVKEDYSIVVTDHSLNGTEVDVAVKVDKGPANPWEILAKWPEAPKAAPGEFIDSTPWSDPRPVDASPSEVLAASSSQEDMRIARLRRLSAKPLPRGRDSSGNNLDRRLEVTPQSLEDAALAYRYSDHEIKSIIHPYTTDEVWREEDIHQLVRNNDELRFQLMQYLMDKLDKTTYLPDRLRRNTEKQLNYVGYEKMSSREAAAVLALEMLSGTYERTTDSIDVNKFREVVQGQHRWGAMLALGVNDTEYARSVMNIRRQ